MNYDWTAIPEAEVPRASDPLFQHLVATSASETNKTASIRSAVTDDLLDFRPHEKSNTIRTIFKHQLLSERRFFAQFVGTSEPAAETLLPASPDAAGVGEYLDRYVRFAKLRLPQFAAA